MYKGGGASKSVVGGARREGMVVCLVPSRLRVRAGIRRTEVQRSRNPFVEVTAGNGYVADGRNRNRKRERTLRLISLVS